jgi:methylmalonyl-CoA/ethylmalonyl-CoA epimerase
MIETPSSASAQVLQAVEQQIVGIDHVAVAVADLEEAIRWYTKTLGFRCVERRETRGERTGMISAVMVAGAAVIVLIQGMEPESQVCRFMQRFGSGVQHLALQVRDFDRALAAIREAGAALDTSIIEGIGLRQAFLRRDPGSGVRIEIIYRGGGEFSDRSVQQLFRDFEADDLY